MSLAEEHREKNSKDIPTLVDCGCKAIVWDDENGVEIEFCPLHASAQSLVDGADLALGELDRIIGDIGFEPDRYKERITASNVLNDAVRRARGWNRAR